MENIVGATLWTVTLPRRKTERNRIRLLCESAHGAILVQPRHVLKDLRDGSALRT